MDNKSTIDHVRGLRGLAIIFITLSYVDNQMWGCGRYGFDIFFVIAGWLLFNSRARVQGKETLMDCVSFVVRRFQKVLPPMITVVFLTVAAGAFLLWCEDESLLSWVGIKTLLINGNYLAEGGGQIGWMEKNLPFVPITHLWYLIVLMKLYILWSCSCYVLQGLAKPKLLATLSVIGVLSLIYFYSYPIHEWLKAGGIVLWEQDAPVSVYATLTHVWELLVGGAVMMLPSLRRRRGAATGVAIVGLFVLLATMLVGAAPLLEDIVVWPRSLAIAIGTALVIRYLPASHLKSLLNNKAMLWLGGMAFSLYLVSMPVVVYGKMFVFGEPNLLHLIIIFVAVALAGWVMRKTVEKHTWPLVPLAVLWSVTMLLCLVGRFTDGFRNIVPSQQLEIPKYTWALTRDEYLRADWDDKLEFADDVLRFVGADPLKDTSKRVVPLLLMGDQNNEATIALIGDSHAAHHYAGMDAVCRKEQLGGVYCATSFSPFDRVKSIDLLPRERALLKWLDDHPEIRNVVISLRWTAYLHSMADTFGKKKETELQYAGVLRDFCKELNDMGKSVIVIGPEPEFNMGPIQNYSKTLALRGLGFEAIAPTCSREQLERRNRRVLPILRQLEKEGLFVLLNPLDSLAADEKFRSVEGNTLLMHDRHNMYAPQSIRIIGHFSPLIKDMVDKKNKRRS